MGQDKWPNSCGSDDRNKSSCSVERFHQLRTEAASTKRYFTSISSMAVPRRYISHRAVPVPLYPRRAVCPPHPAIWRPRLPSGRTHKAAGR